MKGRPFGHSLAQGCGFSCDQRGIVIKMSDYGTQTFVRMVRYIDFITSYQFQCCDEEFKVALLIAQMECDHEAESSDDIWSKMRNILLNPQRISSAHLKSMAKNISIEDLNVFKKEMFTKCFLRILTYGIVSEQSAIHCFDHLVKRLSMSPIVPPKQVYATLNCQPGVYYYRESPSNDKCSTVAQFHCSPDGEFKDFVYANLLQGIFHQKFTHFMQKQLYSIEKCEESESYPFTEYHEPSIGFLLTYEIEDKNVDFDKIRGYVRAFWTRLAVRIVAGVRVETIKNILNNLKKHLGIHHIHMMLLLLGDSYFEREKILDELCENITPENLLEYFVTHYMDPKTSRIILVEISGHDRSVDKLLPEALKGDENFCASFDINKVLKTFPNINGEIVNKRLTELKSNLLDSNFMPKMPPFVSIENDLDSLWTLLHPIDQNS